MYTLADFARIEKKCNDVLPIEVKQRIYSMCKVVGAQPVFTIMVQNKSSLQDAIREINKLTDTNFASQSPLIIEIVSQIDVTVFADIFFTIVSKNPFCSKTYALLFLQLQKKWDLMNDVFETKFKEYLNSFEQIVSVEQDNYDEFCEWKAANDRRRTFTLFVLHLTELSSIPSNYYHLAVETIMQRIDGLLDLQDRNIMNEMVENLFLYKPNKPEWVDKIKQWVGLKPTEHVGLNYKIIFRFMDILK